MSTSAIPCRHARDGRQPADLFGAVVSNPEQSDNTTRSNHP